MTDKTENTEKQAVDLSSLAELSFGPDWARKPSSEISFSKSSENKRASSGKRERKKTDRRQFKPGRLAPDRSPDRNIGEKKDFYRRPDEYKRPYIEMPPIYVRFLPEQDKLSAICKKIHSTKLVYPLTDLAKLIFASPGACYIKMELERDKEPVIIFQCKECRTAGLDYEKMLNHAADAHLDLFFDVEEIEVEAPSGTFPCIAKCTLGNEIIAPPNHHSYNQSVKDLYDSKYSKMPREEFEQAIVTVKDDEAIEKWKESAKRQTVYRLKAPVDGVPETMNRSEAVRYILRESAQKLITKTKAASMSMDTARKLEDPALKLVFNAGWRRENRFPRSLLLALRAALKHMKLHVFKFGGADYYVTSVKPEALKTEFVVEEWAEILNFLKENPGCRRTELIAGLRPGESPESEAAEKVFAQLHLLVDLGHILEFVDGRLFVAGYKPPPEKKTDVNKQQKNDDNPSDSTGDKQTDVIAGTE